MTSDDILISLRKIIRALNIESKRIQKEFGVSIPQLLALHQLKRSTDYQATITELSRSLNLNPSTITGIIRRLEKRGLVARLPKMKDKRLTFIALTASGAELLEKTPKLFHEKLDERLNLLSEEQKISIQEGLSLLTGMLEVEEIDASPLLMISEELTEEEDSL